MITIMPIIDCLKYTKGAVEDVLLQTLDTRLLIVDNGSNDETRAWLDEAQLRDPTRVIVWHHLPPLPSLAATWNRALHFAWEIGENRAFVINNDVHLHEQTFERLSRVLDLTAALFVTATGISNALPAELDESDTPYGGPDFSCFCIRRSCHERFPFDERYIPAYCEDLDYHRRLLLDGEGSRIFSANVPFVHFASRTINRSPEAFKAFQAGARQSQAYHAAKWGGGPNEERYTVPFDPKSGIDSDVSTHTLFDHARAAGLGVVEEDELQAESMVADTTQPVVAAAPQAELRLRLDEPDAPPTA